MSNITNPLQALINTAAQTLPARTGVVAQHAERARRASRTAVLADVSGSMSSQAWGGRSKHEVLREALSAIDPGRHDLVAFSETAARIADAGDLPVPSGGTALDRGLEEAMRDGPGRILVISDGQPDDELAALAVARQFDGTIDVLYIGPDSDVMAMRFLEQLARCGRGQYHGSDIARATAPALVSTVRTLLLK